MKPYGAAAAGAALLAIFPLGAGAQPHCSRETLPVRGTPVTIAYCITGQHAAPAGEEDLPVQATYSTAATSFTRSSTMRFVTSAGPARLLESVDLAPLGLQGTLHLTLVYASGLVRIQNALLTPGAVTIK
jgi:hypothetical protein